MTTPTHDELRWCHNCDEWMYARDCEGDPIHCGRRIGGPPTPGFVLWPAFVLAMLFAALIVIQIVAAILHLMGSLP